MILTAAKLSMRSVTHFATLRTGAEQEANCIAALEQEMQGLQEERAKVTKLRAQLESATARMEQEQAAWAKRKASVACC